MDAEAQHGCGEGKRFFWRWNFSVGWILRLGVGAAKVNKFLVMGFRRRMDAEARHGCGEGKQFFGDGISALDGY